jgi:hypothetical protein
MKRRGRRSVRTSTLLKILALGKRQVKKGQTVSAEKAFKRLRERRSEGPLTQAQMDAIDRLQPPGRSKMTKSLF